MSIRNMHAALEQRITDLEARVAKLEGKSPAKPKPDKPAKKKSTRKA